MASFRFWLPILGVALAASGCVSAKKYNAVDALASSLRKDLDAANRRGAGLADRLFFDSGQAVIREDGRALLRRVAEVLANLPDRAIRIEGHTDDMPITGALAQIHPTNWELGAARAVHVLRFLVEEAGLDPQRLAGVTFGQYQPVADNATAEGRARNRRIEIVFVEAPRRAPAAATTATAP